MLNALLVKLLIERDIFFDTFLKRLVVIRQKLKQFLKFLIIQSKLAFWICIFKRFRCKTVFVVSTNF